MEGAIEGTTTGRNLLASEVSPLTTAKIPRGTSSIHTKSSKTTSIWHRSPSENIMKRFFDTFTYDATSQSDGYDENFSENRTGDNDFRSPGTRGKPACISFCFMGLIGTCLFLVGIFAGFFFENAKDQSMLTNAERIKALSKDSALSGLLYGAVATDHDACSEVGSFILQKGGNAVDAAVASTLCLGIANPASSGLGGGAFILIHSDRAHHEARWANSSMASTKFLDKRHPDFPTDAEKVTEVIDCREVAPRAVSEDMFLSKPNSASAIGGLSVAVPGELQGLELAHARHGSLPWSELLEPAIKMAKDGIPVSMHLANEIEYLRMISQRYGDSPALRKLLTHHNSWESRLKEGELLRNPALGDTLSSISRLGSRALYEGDLATRLSEDVQAQGGILTAEDMAGYFPVLRDPVYGIASGYTVVGVPPPSSGGATIIGAARFLSGYELPLAGNADTLSVHRMVEALRHAFAIRMSLSDPDFFENKTTRAMEDLTMGAYMEGLRRVTKDNATLPLSQYGGKKWAQLNNSDDNGEIEDAHEGDRRLRRHRALARTFGYLDDFGTSHLSVVDKDGNAVAITTSVNQVFGSQVFSESTGVLLGDTMDDFGNPGRSNFFGLKPSEENFIAPGKRPLSSMSPTMVFRRHEGSNTFDFGRLELVVGGSGGPKIITAVLQVILNYCFFGKGLFESVAHPRVHDQLLYHDAAVTTTENSQLEQGPTISVSQRTKDALLARGHENLLDIDYAGTVQAVAIDFETNSLSAVSDIRKGGKPAGY